MLQVASAVPSRSLIPLPLWDRLVARVEKDEVIPRGQAEQIMDSTIEFLDLCAKNPQRRFAPSPLVDVGWHTFILYTKDYADFCHSQAGRFIHHEPNDNPVVGMEAGGACATLAFMKENGIQYNSDMWAHAASNCSDCDGGSGPGPTSDCTCS